MALMPLFSAHDWIAMVANTKQKPIQENYSFYDFPRILKQELGTAAGLFNTFQRDELA